MITLWILSLEEEQKIKVDTGMTFTTAASAADGAQRCMGTFFYFLNSPYYTPAVCALAVYDPGNKSNSPFIHVNQIKKKFLYHVVLHICNPPKNDVQLLTWNGMLHVMSKYSEEIAPTLPRARQTDATLGTSAHRASSLNPPRRSTSRHLKKQTKKGSHMSTQSSCFHTQFTDGNIFSKLGCVCISLHVLQSECCASRIRHSDERRNDLSERQLPSHHPAEGAAHLDGIGQTLLRLVSRSDSL